MSDEAPVTEAPKKEDEIPAWARDAITKANSQAAETRVSLKEANTNLADLQKSYDELANDAEVKKLQLEALSKDSNGFLRLKAALTADIPGGTALEIFDRLRGDTLEDLVEDAKTLSSKFPSPKAEEVRVKPTDPTQGRTGNSVTQDPAILFANSILGR